MQSAEEIFELVDAEGRVIGQAPRWRCHGDPSLRHRAVHVLVFDRAGSLFLQKRSIHKDSAPGLWDTSVGGHMQPGEQPEQSARREFIEELGTAPGMLHPAYGYEWSTRFETERIIAYATRHEGPFSLHPEEIEEGRFWSQDAIRRQLDSGLFTPQFRHEFARMQAWWREHHHLLEDPAS